jgi:hypothetical protein
MIISLYYNKGVIAAAFLILLASLLSCSVYASTQEASTTSPVCGNGIQETGEQCDGSDLGGASCVSRGFSGGTLSCASSCVFDTSSCTSGGGGGGGGGGYVPPSVTSVIFSGRAYPKSTVTLLKDAQIAATTVAGADANFQISISGLSGGNYIFSVYSEDKAGRRSSLLTFQVSVTQGATTSVTGVFVAPTIAVDKSAVKRGDNIAIFGQSTPQSDITIVVNSEEEFFSKTISDKDGIYLYNFDTTVLEYGSHNTKSKASIGNQLVSGFSYLVNFKVGTETIIKEEQEKNKQEFLEGNLNDDDRVNLVDFSIMAYWYNRSSPPDNVDLNNDHKIDLVDFSIMAYYWTG